MNKREEGNQDLRRTLLELRELVERGFGPDTAAPGFGGATPSAGQCAAVAVIAHELLGGQFVSAKVHGLSHWFNRIHVDGQWLDFDLTGDQFGRDPVQVASAGYLYPGTTIRHEHEVNPETLERAIKLAERSGLVDAARQLREHRHSDITRRD